MRKQLAEFDDFMNEKSMIERIFFLFFFYESLCIMQSTQIAGC